MNNDLAQRAAKKLRELMFDDDYDRCRGCSCVDHFYPVPADDEWHDKNCEYIKLVKELEGVAK